jgi:ankyrin repeat protein
MHKNNLQQVVVAEQIEHAVAGDDDENQKRNNSVRSSSLSQNQDQKQEAERGANLSRPSSNKASKRLSFANAEEKVPETSPASSSLSNSLSKPLPKKSESSKSKKSRTPQLDVAQLESIEDELAASRRQIEKDAMIRAHRADLLYNSVWHMVLSNRTPGLGVALEVDPNLVRYVGGPGLRCVYHEAGESPQWLWQAQQQGQDQQQQQNNSGERKNGVWEISLLDENDVGGGTQEFGASLLHYAVFANSPAACALLVTNGADIDSTTTRSGGLTAYQLAQAMGRVELARRLVSMAATTLM